MKRTTIQVGSFQVNCSILSEENKAWIIDPGQESDRIIAFLTERALTPQAILLTHVHFDHISAIPDLLKAYPGLRVYLHTNDRSFLTHPMNRLPPEYPGLSTGDLPFTTDLGALTDNGLKIIETPGHTPGGVCFFFPKSEAFEKPLLLAGDTLFAGSVGRTDLPGGNMATLMGSLQKLCALPDETIVVPGHGWETTIGAEKQSNPFLLNF